MSDYSHPRVYDREFKLRLMRQWEAGERSCAQLVREHRLAQSVLYRWRATYRQLGDNAFREVAVTVEHQQGERIASLERALGQLTLENQILKKGLQLAQSRSAKP